MKHLLDLAKSVARAMLYLLLLVAAGVSVDLVDRGLVVVLVNGVMRLTSVGILACCEF